MLIGSIVTIKRNIHLLSVAGVAQCSHLGALSKVQQKNDNNRRSDGWSKMSDDRSFPKDLLVVINQRDKLEAKLAIAVEALESALWMFEECKMPQADVCREALEKINGTQAKGLGSK